MGSSPKRNYFIFFFTPKTSKNRKVEQHDFVCSTANFSLGLNILDNEIIHLNIPPNFSPSIHFSQFFYLIFYVKKFEVNTTTQQKL